MNKFVCESFINYCDELLIPAEEGWLQRLFAKSSSKKDVDRISKIWGYSDSSTDTKEKAETYIKKVMSLDTIRVDCDSLMADAAITNLPQNEFIKIAKKFYQSV